MEKHAASIFAEFDLSLARPGHRGVLAVLRYLKYGARPGAAGADGTAGG